MLATYVGGRNLTIFIGTQQNFDSFHFVLRLVIYLLLLICEVGKSRIVPFIVNNPETSIRHVFYNFFNL